MNLANKDIDGGISLLAVVIENNALLESVADLMIKTAAGDNEEIKETLSSYFE